MDKVERGLHGDTVLNVIFFPFCFVQNRTKDHLQCVPCECVVFINVVFINVHQKAH